MFRFRHPVKRILPFVCTCITIGVAVPVLEQQHQPNVSYGSHNGGWDNWSAWSPCSQACGSGLSCQERQCSSDTCLGSRRRYRSCNVQPCTDSQPNLRASQCAEFNSVASDGSAKVWIPLSMANTNQCQLICQLNGTSDMVIVKNTVRDGTKCSGDHGVCIDGRCLRLGCDGILGSDKVLDQCGRCLHPLEANKTSDSCRQFIGQNIQKHLENGYSSVVTIPFGATSINITTLGAYRNHIRVRTNKMDGHEQAVFDKETSEGVVAGTHFQVMRLNTCATCVPQWAILGKGKNTEALEVEVFSASTNYGILYSYFTVLHEDDKELEEDNSTLRLKRAKRTTNFCSRFVWALAPPTPCSVTCGNGTRATRYQCVYHSSSSRQPINVPERYCSCKARPAPINEVCEKPACASRWEVGSWGSCSTMCGTGVRERKVKCLQQVSDVETIEIPAHQCDQASRPPATEVCREEQCKAQWRISVWLECDGACGENMGVQSRIVLCYTREGQVTNDSECDRQSKPISIQPCTRNCSLVAVWKSSDWSQCSAQCGAAGNRTRVVTCVIEHEQRDVIGLDESCSAPKPATNDTCQASCTWATAEWHMCSRTCGGGTQSRSVQCVDSLGLPMTGCSQEAKPVTIQSCNEEACPCRNPRDSQWCKDVIADHQISCQQVKALKDYCCNYCQSLLQ